MGFNFYLSTIKTSYIEELKTMTIKEVLDKHSAFDTLDEREECSENLVCPSTFSSSKETVLGRKLPDLQPLYDGNHLNSFLTEDFTYEGSLDILSEEGLFIFVDDIKKCIVEYYQEMLENKNPIVLKWFLEGGIEKWSKDTQKLFRSDSTNFILPLGRGASITEDMVYNIMNLYNNKEENESFLFFSV